MLRRLVITAALLVAVKIPPASAATLVSEVEAYPGIVYATYTTGGAQPTTIHVVRVDLSSSEITVVATRTDERGLKPSQFANQRAAQVVINGDLFSPSGFQPAGVARGGAVTWDDSVDDETSGFVSFSKNVGGTEVGISAPSEVVASLPPEVSDAVGGRPILVVAGAAQDPDCDDAAALPCIRAPRTAVATSADGRTMFLVVADGWQQGSAGLRASELGVFLAADLGARSGLQLDGGSASAMFIENQGGLVSSPSDGSERVVANHIGVIHGELPSGLLRGGVFDTVIDGTMLVGATVTLDTGEQTTYTGQLWSFVVPPRFVCATGSADGFQDQTQCRQIFSGEAVFGSMALLPNGVPGPDAGSAASDAGPSDDAGNQGPGDDPGGCGCEVGAGSPSEGLPVLAWLFAMFFVLPQRRRNRRT